MKTILIGGAMDVEIEYFLAQLEEMQMHKFYGFNFFEGMLAGKKVIISKTEIGIASAAIATMIGIYEFHPDIVINQGTAGAHTENLHRGDIVIGETCRNINAFDMLPRAKSEGIEPTKWEMNGRAEIFSADERLVEIFDETTYGGGKKICGRLGSGDIFSRESDRIEWLIKTCGEDCEDMESASVYAACKSANLPCVGVRVISNNELCGEEFDDATAICLQEFICKAIEKI